MSNPACILYDICGFKVGDMECIDIAKSEDGLEPQEENQKVEKLKESHLLLKKKLSLSHELIRQYNDKIKECQQVSTESETVKNNFRKVTTKFHSSLAKITQLKLENQDYRQKIANHSKIVSELETKLAANQQHLQQLICKVEQFEQKEINTAKLKKDDSSKERVKILEAELKAVKDSHKSDLAQMEIKIKSIKAAESVKTQAKKNGIKIGHDKATCTSKELEPVIPRPETVEKCTMTNEFYNIKDDPYPLFCSKCLIKLDPAPLDQILEHMTACPTMITAVSSPSKESDIKRLHRSPRALTSRDAQLAATSNANSLDESLDSVGRNSDVSKSDFQRLERKIYLLERKLRKKVDTGVQERNSCCGFSQFPNNCYLGPYQNLFQPAGSMIRSQLDLFPFQNWQEGLRNRKRSRKISSIQKLNRRSTKSRKKRKLNDGTSEWNVDSVPSREFIDSDHTSASENYSDQSNIPLGTESLPSHIYNSKNEASKRFTDIEFSPPLRRKKQEKLASLFTPLRSPSPKLNDGADNEAYSETRIESSRVLNETFSDEEILRNGSEPPEYETVECGKRKRSRPPQNAVKTSAKNSLVAKIRNLKKNCNKIKPITTKTSSANNNSIKIVSNQIVEATVPVNEFETSENGQNLNTVDDYCPVKKHRIAHSARKSENDFLCEVDKDLIEIPKTNFQEDSVSDSLKDDTTNKTVAIIEKLDNVRDKVETDLRIRRPESVFQIERRNNSIDSSNTNSCSESVEKPAATYFQVESLEGIIETESTMNSNVENESASLIDKTSDETEKTDPLQPCGMIQRIYSGIKDVEDSCIETEEDESAANLGLNINKTSSKDQTIRILRSKSKIVTKSNDKLSSKNDETMKIMDLNTHPAESHSDNEISESISDIQDTTMSVKSDKSEDVNNEGLEIDKNTSVVGTARKYKRRIKTITASASPMRELRSRRIMLSPSSNTEGKISSSKNESEETDNENVEKILKPSKNQGRGPKALIKQLLIKRSSSHQLDSKKKFNEKLQERKENLVMNELTKLADDPDWAMAVLLDAIERLSNFKTHTIAKCTLDFLVTRAEDDKELDKTHTPPAPLLSKTQQRVLTMLVVLNRTMPNIIKLVQAGIEFRLFRLGYAPEVNVVEGLARIYTAFAIIQKDREKVRILCYDALYCLGLKAMPLIYVILVSWPGVLPMAGTSSDPLILCLIDSIMTQTGDTNFPKFFALKKLLTGYYSYESGGCVTNALAKNMMTSLKEKRQNGLDTAIILLAKKKGPHWTHENIIKGGLLQMIIQKTHPSIYDAFSLLGHLMRSFPVDDKDGLVKNILDQLCALMESGEGSMEQQEGVAKALLSLHRHKPKVVAKTILNWEPKEPLSESTSRQLTSLFDSQPSSLWANLLHKNRVKLTQARK